MSENVMQFPLPPGQLWSFRMGGREHILVIRPIRRGQKRKRAQVINIATKIPRRAKQ
jgi:hypothetical protein